MNTSIQWRADDCSNGSAGNPQPPVPLAAERAVVGLRVFLAVVTSLFLLLIIAWLMRSQFNDWQALSQPWQPLAQPWQLILNTGLLISASVCLQIAYSNSRAGDSGRSTAVKHWALFGGLFTLLFLGGQLWLWHQLSATGFGVAANPANSFFYLLTGLHGMHLAGGLVAWLRLALRWPASGDSLRLRLRLCCTYWHYLLLIWLLLFALLISPPATIALIASFCGLSPP